jgi:hypothetical protein
MLDRISHACSDAAIPIRAANASDHFARRWIVIV